MMPTEEEFAHIMEGINLDHRAKLDTLQAQVNTLLELVREMNDALNSGLEILCPHISTNVLADVATKITNARARASAILAPEKTADA